MKKWYIPILAFFILLMLNFPFFPIATSVIPGWHTTIYPPYFVAGVVLIVMLMLIIIGYWLLLKRGDKVNWTLFVLHLVLTLPVVIFLKFPFLLLNIQLHRQEVLFTPIYLLIRLISISWVLFWIGQLLFIIYFVRTMLRKRIVS